MNSAVPVNHFQFETYRLAYRVLGNGPIVMLTFHGFGQDSCVFEVWERLVHSRYTIYAIDLFFHGESLLLNGSPLTKTDWQRLINGFLTAQGIDRFSLAGFSLGGRFALVTAEQFMPRLEQLILMAPDGITQTIWYRLATGTGPGQWAFRLFLRHLSVLSRLGRVLVKMRLLHRTVLRFAEISLATPEQRQQVYLSWTRFYPVAVDVPVLAALLNRSPVRVRFFTGYFDQIVPGRYILPLTSRLHSYELTVLKTGHNRLIEQVGGLL